MSNFEQSPIGHRCSLWADVKELYGPRSFCSSGGAAVYLYTGKVAHPLAAPHLLFERCSHSKSSNSFAAADATCRLNRGQPAEKEYAYERN